MGEKVFLDYDQAELDRQYDHRSWAPNAAEVIASYGTLSAAARRTLDCRRDVSYGPSPGQTLDIFPPPGRGPAPVQIFLHGGQWQRLSKAESAFAAPAFVAAGAAFVAVGFDLIPHVTLDEIVDQVRAAVLWAHRHIAAFGGDPERLFVGGHSSGGHLTAMLATTDWTAYGLDATPLRGAACVSGTYDLAPQVLSFRGGYLGLDAAGVARNSPIGHLDRLEIPLVVAYGEGETDEFRRQGAAFADAARAAGGACRRIDLAGRNHFETALDLGDPGGPLARAVFAQMGL